MSSPAETAELGFQLWLACPQDVSSQILLNFLDGKSVSTLLLAIAGCRRHLRVALSVVMQVLSRRIEHRTKEIMERTNGSAVAIRIQRFLSDVMLPCEVMDSVDETVENYDIKRVMADLSHKFAIMDYFESGRAISNINMEFPVWQGDLRVDVASSVHTNSAVRISTVLWTPFWSPKLIRSLLNSSERQNGFRFHLRNRNFRTVPPIGVIRGVRDVDEDNINLLVERMEVFGQVLTSLPQRYNSPGEISLFHITEGQARKNVLPSLIDRLDPYQLKQETKSHQHKPSMYCLWTENWDQDEELDSDDVMRDILLLMRRLNAS